MQYMCKDAHKDTSARRHQRLGQRKSEPGATPGIAQRRRLARFRLFSKLRHSCATWPFNNSIPMVVYATVMRSRALYLLLLVRRRSFAAHAERLPLPDARAACSFACLDAPCYRRNAFLHFTNISTGTVLKSRCPRCLHCPQGAQTIVDSRIWRHFGALGQIASAGHQGLASGGDAPAVSVSEDLGGACCFLRPFFIVTNVGCIKWTQRSAKATRAKSDVKFMKAHCRQGAALTLFFLDLCEARLLGLLSLH